LKKSHDTLALRLSLILTKLNSGESFTAKELAEEFKAENGSIICRELLGLDHKKDDPIAEARTEAYYKKRPCAELVHMAATIVGKKIQVLNAIKEK
jgi:hypothetical protein